MTETNRYLTCGVDNTIPLELQLFMWDCVDRLPEPKDYLQVFELMPWGRCSLSLTHPKNHNTARSTSSRRMLPLRKNCTSLTTGTTQQCCLQVNIKPKPALYGLAFLRYGG